MFLSYFRQPKVKKGIVINLGLIQRNLVSGITLLFVFSIKCPTNCMNFCINITFILVSGYHPTPLVGPCITIPDQSYYNFLEKKLEGISKNRIIVTLFCCVLQQTRRQFGPSEWCLFVNISGHGQCGRKRKKRHLDFVQ